MADVFDVNKKNRGSYEGWDKTRRDPRLKSVHLKESNENNTSGIQGGQQWGSQKQEFPQDIYNVPSRNPQPINQGENQDLWKQSNFQQNPYGPPMQSMYNDPRQQYSTMYPQQGQYSQYATGRMQPDYSQNQYQQSFYTVAENSYIPQPAAPPGAWRNSSHSENFHDPNHPSNIQSSTTVQHASQTNETKNEGSKKAAVAEEMKQQRATIRKQREDCMQKSAMLKRELELLKTQKQDLLAEYGSGSIPRETQRILRKNTKLQMEIQEKIKAMNAVIDMLSGITTEDSNREKSFDRLLDSNDRQKSPKQESTDSPTNSGSYNMVHYDPELHWCRVCDVFPTSAKDFLTHLQSETHRETSQQHQMVDTPWHNLPPDPEIPIIPGAPTKRTPIKGLQFFLSAPAWYCKLCDKWIGDLHCASLHLKSKIHIQNYNNFIEQNPFWEADWLSDRKKAFTRAQKKSLHGIIDATTLNETSPAGDYSPGLKDGKRKKHSKDKRDSSTSSRDKKKKKKSKKRKKAVSSDSSSTSSSSSSSSDDETNESDKTKSIRVAMRNKMKMQAQKLLSEEFGEKYNALSKFVEDKNQRKTYNQDNSTGISSKIDSKDLEEGNDSLVNFQYLRNRFKPTHLRTQESSFKDNSTSEMRRSSSKERDSDRRRYSRRSRSRSPRKRSYDRYDSPGHKKYRDKYSPKKYNDRYSPFDKKKKYDRYETNDYKNKNSSHFNDKYSREKEENDKHRDDKFIKKNKEVEEKNEAEENKPEKPSETAATNKSPPPTQTQKKMPFIGRMPLFKKKIDEDKKNESEKQEKSKFAVNLEAQKMLPAPGLVHISHLAAPMYPFNADNPPPPPQIIPDPPQIIPEPPQISDYMRAPPPPVLSHLMEDQSGSITSDGKTALPRDFQDALGIIFPGDKPKDEISAESQEAAILMAQFRMMNEAKASTSYSYPGYDPQLLQSYVLAAQMPPLPPEEEADDDSKDVSKADDAEISGNDKDDLALLGIDAEDLAAQNL